MNETSESKPKRVWEIDALRGMLILIVLAYHLYFTVEAFMINGHYHIDSLKYVETTDPLHFWFTPLSDGTIVRSAFPKFIVEYMQPLGVDSFFVISGIACLFSRNNKKNTVRLFIAAGFIAAFTYGLSVWTGDPTRFIRFGALACYAFCHLIYEYLLKKRSNETLLFVALIALAIGYYLRYHGVPSMDVPIFYIFGVRQTGDLSSDYWPILPMLGWFLAGVVIGRKYYSEKKTLLPYRLPDKFTKPLQFLGRHSGIIYVGHIVIYTAFFCGIGYIFGLL